MISWLVGTFTCQYKRATDALSVESVENFDAHRLKKNFDKVSGAKDHRGFSNDLLQPHQHRFNSSIYPSYS